MTAIALMIPFPRPDDEKPGSRGSGCVFIVDLNKGELPEFLSGEFSHEEKTRGCARDVTLLNQHSSAEGPSPSF